MHDKKKLVIYIVLSGQGFVPECKISEGRLCNIGLYFNGYSLIQQKMFIFLLQLMWFQKNPQKTTILTKNKNKKHEHMSLEFYTL